jgi:3-hydroxyacyl-[acyl-carrier-protein] dehydratase
LSAFSFVDNVSEVEKGQSITAFFTLKGDEEFLLDHFEGFPVMPGVLLLESLKQAACKLLDASTGKPGLYRLAAVREVKFGQFVKPGSRVELKANLTGQERGRSDFEGRVRLVENGAPGPRALQASFSLMPVQER